MNFFELRDKYPRFIYHQYFIEEQAGSLHVSFHFEIPGLAEFKPSWVFPLSRLAKPQHTHEELESYVFNLGMIELISYWKCVCPPIIDIKCGKLDLEQMKFWKHIYISGLGEFKHLNNIDIADELFINFSEESLSLGDMALHRNSSLSHLKQLKALIPVGGGKDSIVSLEKLRSLDRGRFAYSINANPAVISSMDIAGIPEERRVLPKRTLDPKLLELNALGYLNGHTPFSAIVAFSAALAAYLYGIDDIVLSNESSANESTVKDSDVNHQYSKTSEFEHNFAEYLKTYLNPEQRYFSLLRPFSELAIARQFARYSQYFKAFRSCNRGSKTNSWCGACAKCLFVAAILLPFLGVEQVHKIIGREIFDDAELASMLDELCGYHDEKPFECVGTVEEVNLAIVMYINQVLEAAKTSAPEFSTLPYLISRFAKRAYASKTGDVLWNAASGRIELLMPSGNPLSTIYEGHRVPDEYLPFLAGFVEGGEAHV